jgi:hypothetical protein
LQEVNLDGTESVPMVALDEHREVLLYEVQ